MRKSGTDLSSLPFSGKVEKQRRVWVEEGREEGHLVEEGVPWHERTLDAGEQDPDNTDS